MPEDVERKLGLSLLGVVPRSEGDPDEALADPKSPMSEGYNALRASLLHATSHGLPPVMLVTSAQAAEGKTTTSEAIARAPWRGSASGSCWSTAIFVVPRSIAGCRWATSAGFRPC